MFGGDLPVMRQSRKRERKMSRATAQTKLPRAPHLYDLTTGRCMSDRKTAECIEGTTE